MAIVIPLLTSFSHGQQLHVIIAVQAAWWTHPRLLCYELQENLGGNFESWVVHEEGLE